MSLDVLKAKARAVACRLAAWAKRTVAEAMRPLPLVSGLIEDVFRSREELVAENLLLRQQLVVASRKVKQPRFRPLERGLFVLLASKLQRWREATLLVKPDTVLRWHSEGFRLLWKRKSKAGRVPKPRLPQETIDLIVRMSEENRLWGAERIRGELLKLGIRVGKRTVQKYMYRGRSSGPRDGQSWKTFLKNHTVWAWDFLQLYGVWCTAPSVLPRSARAVGLRGLRPACWTPSTPAPTGLRVLHRRRERDARCARRCDARADGAVDGATTA